MSVDIRENLSVEFGDIEGGNASSTFVVFTSDCDDWVFRHVRSRIV